MLCPRASDKQTMTKIMFEKADELTQFLNEDSIVWHKRLWWWVKRPIKRDGPSQISSFCLPCPLFSVMWKWYIFWSMTIRLHNWTGQICTRKVCVISRNSLGISKIDDIYGKGSLCIPNWMSQISFDPHIPRLYFVNYIANFSQIHQNYTRNTPKKSTIQLLKMAPIPIWNSSEK